MKSYKNRGLILGIIIIALSIMCFTSGCKTATQKPNKIEVVKVPEPAPALTPKPPKNKKKVKEVKKESKDETVSKKSLFKRILLAILSVLSILI